MYLDYLTPERVTLVHLLEEADIKVYEDVGDCDIGDYAGYTMSDPVNDSITVSYTHLTLPTNREV